MSPTRMAASVPSVPESARLMLALALGFGGLAWLAIYYLWPMPFWAMQDDYAYLALAHAVNLESMLRDGVRHNDAGLWGHPGIPFYLVSWLCLRAVAVIAGAADELTYTLEYPQDFFIATRAAAGLITLGTLLATWRVLSTLAPARRALALAAFFACGPQSFGYGLTFLSNETFALPLAALFFAVLKRLSSAPLGCVVPWILLGAAAGLGYAVKPLYLNLLAGALALALVDSRFQHPRIGIAWAGGAAMRGAATAVGFVVLLAPLLLLVVGPAGTDYLVNFHMDVFTHASRYGTGEAKLVSTAAVGQALYYLLAHPMLPLLGIALAALLLRPLASQRNAIERAEVLWGTAALTALLAALAAVLKHFSPHYLGALAAVMPFLAAPVLTRMSYPGFRKATAVVLALVAASLFNTVMSFEGKARMVAQVMDDEAAINSMPLKPGEARLWTYNVASPHFAMGFVAGSAGVPALVAAQKDPKRSELSSHANVERPYRYVVLDRTYYKDVAAVQSHRGPLDPTKGVTTELGAQDRLIELKRTIVVERSVPP